MSNWFHVHVTKFDAYNLDKLIVKKVVNGWQVEEADENKLKLIAHTTPIEEVRLCL